MKQEKTPNNKNDYNVEYNNYMDTNASTECTGLMYHPADDRDEWDDYHEIFNFTPPSPGYYDDQK